MLRHEYLQGRHPNLDKCPDGMSKDDFIRRVCAVFRDADRIAHLYYDTPYDQDVDPSRARAYSDVCDLIEEYTVPAPPPEPDAPRVPSAPC